MEDLFSFSQNDSPQENIPLSERARPKTFDDFAGQSDILSKGPKLKELILKDKTPSLIFWGPPGSGKTSLALLISKITKSSFISRSAIDTGAKELKEEGEKARYRLKTTQTKTTLFIDEIHRLNRAQQDCLLPYVERGDLILIGATTENPSFEINNALLSRSQVIVFKTLTDQDLKKILERAAKILDEKLSLKDLLEEDAFEALTEFSQGDARRALNYLERIYERFILNGKKSMTAAEIKEAIHFAPSNYDKKSDFHYNTISAFIKSIRGSDPDAALFYLARMLEGGEDPLFIARRLVILASEDVGNAEPRALMVAVAAKEAVDFVGLPEAAINLAQAVTFLASSPKSNRSYAGLRKAQDLVKKNLDVVPPKNILNAPTKLMKKLGFGEGYEYDHDEKYGISKQSFLPEKLQGEVIYDPKDVGSEKNIKTYLDWVKKIRQSKDQ